jgi:drug/metabolite transporter (DMT)-like permease
MAAFILIESVPFVALAFAARRLGRWLTLGCVLAFVGVFVEVDREVSQSTSSTAALGFLVVPFVLLALLLAVLAANEVVRFAIRLRSGATR